MAKQTFTVGQVLTATQMTSLQQTAMGGGSTTAKTTSYTLVAADAGTVVQMNSASATTITVNTALFAAGDTVEIQNVGAGVCTITAGTATVNTSATLAMKQYDAGTLYFNTTSAAFFFAVDAADSPLTTKGDLFTYSTTNDRLAVGANYTFLRANSAAATGLEYAGAYVTFTPTFTSGVTIGNATNTGRYLRIGNLVHVIQKFVLGSTSSITGIIRPDFPLSALNNDNTPIGVVYIEDTGTVAYSGQLIKTAIGSATMQVFSNTTYVSSTNTSATVPMTWTTSDNFQISYIYETNQA